MQGDYDHITHAVKEAGYFTTYRHNAGSTDNLVCVAKQTPQGYTGNSFWVATWKGKWFVATWMNHFYRIPDAARVAELCVEWLKLAPHTTPYDVDERIKARFGLVETDETELGLPPFAANDVGEGEEDRE
jgi:hypothetical protein